MKKLEKVFKPVKKQLTPELIREFCYSIVVPLVPSYKSQCMEDTHLETILQRLKSDGFQQPPQAIRTKSFVLVNVLAEKCSKGFISIVPVEIAEAVLQSVFEKPSWNSILEPLIRAYVFREVNLQHLDSWVKIYEETEQEFARLARVFLRDKGIS